MAYIQKRIDSSLKRAALYARVSTEEQAMHGVSLDAQRERLVQYAKENDLSVVGIYVDEGISARKRYTKRAAFMRMLEDIKAKNIDVVLFIKLDRWFRNIADYYEVQAILDRHKVQWIATEEEYDTTTANGRLALNIKLAIAQDEADRTSERIKFTFQNMVKSGRVISGSTPLGYKIEDKRVVIDEETSPIVQDMFSKYIGCRSAAATSRYILEKYGRHIDLKSMKRMLTNRWYLGEAYGIEGWCPPIIDEQTLDLAESILSVRSARYDGTRTNRVYLFTGILFCGSCGRRMTTYSCHNTRKDGSKQYFIYYRCPAHVSKICELSKQMNQNTLEDWLLKNVRTQAEIYNLDIEKQKQASPKKQIETSKILKKIEKLKDLYLNDLIPFEIYQRDYSSLSSQLQEANTFIIPERKPIDMTIFENFEEMYLKLSEESRKAFWSQILHRINLDRDGTISIEFNT